jgi:hypothetical protein
MARQTISRTPHQQVIAGRPSTGDRPVGKDAHLAHQLRWQLQIVEQFQAAASREEYGLCSSTDEFRYARATSFAKCW